MLYSTALQFSNLHLEVSLSYEVIPYRSELQRWVEHRLLSVEISFTRKFSFRPLIVALSDLTASPPSEYCKFDCSGSHHVWCHKWEHRGKTIVAWNIWIHHLNLSTCVGKYHGQNPYVSAMARRRIKKTQPPSKRAVLSLWP